MAKLNVDKRECMKKYSPSERKEILKAFEKLQNMILTEEKHGIPFEKIFNNETLKYDILGKGFYTFKSHGRDRTQVRILYKFIRKTMQDFELEMHMVSIKRRNDNTYMKDFQKYVDCYGM